MMKSIPTLDASEKDRYALYCLSFSPNWNTYQIISINDKGLMAYGVNMEVFIVDLLNKDFLTSIKPEETTNYKQYKVSSVLLDENMLYTGYAQGSLYCYNHKTNNEILFKLKISKDPIMQILKAQLSEEKFHIIAIDSEGIVYDIITIESIQKQITLKINSYGAVIKAKIYKETPDAPPFLILVSQKGVISIWNLLEEKELFEHDTKTYLTSADIIQNFETGSLRIGVMTKKDQAIIVELAPTHFGNEEMDNGVESIKTSKLHFQIDAKLKNDQEVITARSHIQFLDENRVLLSGKAGEMYKIQLEMLKSKQVMNLKHLSADLEENAGFEVVDRNPHYKQIYSINQFLHKDSNKNYLLALSIDRQLSIWSNDVENSVNDLTHLWDIKFLGGKISQITISELEKNKIFLTCIDKTFRIWDLEKKNNKFSTFDVWKQVSQTPVHNLTLHPSQEGIAAYSSEDNKICLFDLSNQICFKVLKVPKSIRQLFWIKKEHVSYFINFSKMKNTKIEPEEKLKPLNANTNQLPSKEENKEETKSEPTQKDAKDSLKFSFPKQSDPKFKKTLANDFWLLAIHEESIITVYDPTSNPQLIQTEALINQDSFAFTEYRDGVIIATGSKNGACRFMYSTPVGIDEIVTFSNNIYHISCISFNKPKDGNLLCATSSHDRKIIIYEFIPSETSNNGFFILPRITLKHKNKVDKIKWSPANYLLAVASQDKTVQVWNCNITDTDRKGETEPGKTQSREICNIRGHDGYITDAEFSLNDLNIIITASDDQTVKVWDMNTILHKNIAAKKKKNKRKKFSRTSASPGKSPNPAQGEDQIEDPESDEDGEDEPSEK